MGGDEAIHYSCVARNKMIEYSNNLLKSNYQFLPCFQHIIHKKCYKGDISIHDTNLHKYTF